VNRHTDFELSVNGRQAHVRVEPRKLLSDVLREDLGLTGTHVGCEHGVCGACTVLLNGEAVRSCLLFAVQAEGTEITTVEGLTPDGDLSDVQAAIRDCHGLQCGFCTPGFVVTIAAMLSEGCPSSDDAIRVGLSGNLCRCTGYQGLVRAVKQLASATEPA
jgi:aerobic carbon-monoxide dehydrogenase small subunit